MVRSRDADTASGGTDVIAVRLARRSKGTVALAALGLILSACASRFDRYNAGAAELWIGGQLDVQRECERRGVVTYSTATRILGCTDFQERIIVSIPDPKIIAHEWCHWSLWTDSHEACPTPVWP